MAKINVNPKVLKWAREEGNISPQEAAARSKISESRLASYESGEVEPTLTDLRSMARAYQLPLATLVMPEPLTPALKPKDFRTFLGQREELGIATLAAIREAQAYQEYLADVIEDDPKLYHSRQLKHASLSDDPEELAVAERRRSGISIQDQLNWRDEADAFMRWRRYVESLGIFTFLFKMPLSDCRGFSIFEPKKIPIIVINDDEETDQARIFTLFHEYAHLLLRDTGICDENRQNQSERFCNRFSAAFLMPAVALQKVLELNRVAEWSDEEIRFAARRLKVSQQSLILRLVDLGFATQAYYESRMKQWAREGRRAKKQQGGFAPWDLRRLRRFGESYANVVITALEHSVINQLDAYEMLRTKPKALGLLKERLEKRRASNG